MTTDPAARHPAGAARLPRPLRPELRRRSPATLDAIAAVGEAARGRRRRGREAAHRRLRRRRHSTHGDRDRQPTTRPRSTGARTPRPREFAADIHTLLNEDERDDRHCSAPCPSRARRRASGTSGRSRSAATRSRSSSASSPRSGSASGAGWPAAAGRATSRTSRSGRCRSAWSAAGSTTWPPTTSSTSAPAGDPIDALYVWRGGLGVWGAIAFGALGAIIGARRKGIQIAAGRSTRWRPGVLVAQAIGRWGNWFNQELFGRPTDLPWGLEIDADAPARRGYDDRHDVPPDVPLRVLWNLAAFGVLIWARPPVPARPRPGGRALRDGLHRSAAAGSRCCASTPSSSTTCSACGSTSGPRSCCSSLAAVYFVVSARRHPGREESVYVEGRGPRPAPTAARPRTADEPDEDADEAADVDRRTADHDPDHAIRAEPGRRLDRLSAPHGPMSSLHRSITAAAEPRDALAGSARATTTGEPVPYPHAFPPPQGLYDPRHEHDACGVAFVATLTGVASHDIVVQGAHRAAQPRAPRCRRRRAELR